MRMAQSWLWGSQIAVKKKVHSGEINILESENNLVKDDEGMVEDNGDDNDEIDEYLQFNGQQEHERSVVAQS